MRRFDRRMVCSQDIATHTRVTPMQRQGALRKFVNSVSQNPECLKQLEGWGLELDKDTIPVSSHFFYICLNI